MKAKSLRKHRLSEQERTEEATLLRKAENLRRMCLKAREREKQKNKELGHSSGINNRMSFSQRPEWRGSRKRRTILIPERTKITLAKALPETRQWLQTNIARGNSTVTAEQCRVDLRIPIHIVCQAFHVHNLEGMLRKEPLRHRASFGPVRLHGVKSRWTATRYLLNIPNA